MCVFHLGAFSKNGISLIEKQDRVGGLSFLKNPVQILFCLSDVLADDLGKVYLVQVKLQFMRQNEDVLDALVERFMQPLDLITREPLDDRSIADHGYFSAREMRNALRLLSRLDSDVPTTSDLDMIWRYYGESERNDL